MRREPSQEKLGDNSAQNRIRPSVVTYLEKNFENPDKKVNFFGRCFIVVSLLGHHERGFYPRDAPPVAA